MKTIIARTAVLAVLATGATGAVLAGGDCGINSNTPCPPPKSSAKEPAYKSLNSNTPARATLTGITASDLKKPPAGDCGINSNAPCPGQAQEAPARVQAGGDGTAAAKGSLSGLNPADLKLKPKPTSTFEKEPATKP